MSTNSNFRKDKCWSCEFFCGHRKYKTGILFGDSVETDSQGTCSNNRSNNNGKDVRENDWCSKYQKWGVLQSAIAKAELQREQTRQTQEQAQQKKQSTEGLRHEQKTSDGIELERRQIEEERRRLEQARKALEHERWYSSLSPKEREEYDAEQARLKAEQAEREKQAAEHRAEQGRLRKIEQEAVKRKKNKFIIIGACAVVIVIILAICLPIIINTIKNDNDEKEFNESSTGKVLSYIRSKSNGKDEYSFTTSVDDIRIEFTIQYLANGFDTPSGAGSYSKGEGKYSFMATTKVGDRDGYGYSSCYGTAIFNWDSLNEMKNMYLVGEVWYEQYSVYTHYQRYTKGDHCPVINYDGLNYIYGAWDKSLNLEEAEKAGWDSCEMTIIFLNQIANEVFDSNLW